MQKSRGFVAIEYAAILPIILFVTAGVYDLVRMFQAYSALRQGLQISAEEIGKVKGPAVRIDPGTRAVNVEWAKRTYNYTIQDGHTILTSMTIDNVGSTSDGTLPATCQGLDRDSVCYPKQAQNSGGIAPSRQVNFGAAIDRAIEAVRAVYPSARRDCDGPGCVRFEQQYLAGDSKRVNLIARFNLPLAILFGRSLNIATSKEVRFESSFVSKRPHHRNSTCEENLLANENPHPEDACGPNNLPAN